MDHGRRPGCVQACHGCRHRDLGQLASLAQKQQYLNRALARWRDRVAAIATTGTRYDYRDRVTLTVRPGSDGAWQFGLVRRDELIPIPDCPVHTARVRALVRILGRFLPGPEQLPLAYLHVAGAQATLIVKARRASLEVGTEFSDTLRTAGIEGLWLHCHPSAGRRLFARSGWQLAWGRPESQGPGGFVHGPTAFLQALPELHRESMAAARGHLAPGPGVAVLDLYCGLGATLAAWTAAGSAALGVELSGEAVACAALNAPAARVLRGTCLHRLPQVREWWGSASATARVAYVNPPRSGLEADVAAVLFGELRPSRYAYLSCSAGTLARDLALSEASGYRVAALLPYDFFPNTHHVEVLALAVQA